MDKELQEKADKVQEMMDRVAADKKVSREQYREFLQEIETNVQASLSALDEDDRRDAGK